MSKVVVLTGAGISAESGIPTFRGENGLWNKVNVDDVCRVGCLENNRKQTIDFHDNLRISLKDKKPNKAHIELAKLKRMYPNEVTIFTQNVDNLFEKAGGEVIHLHGELMKLQCEECKKVFEIGYQRQEDYFNGICPFCKSKKLRPFVVFYGEPAPNYKKFYKELEDCELFVVIGTSGEVLPVNDIAKNIKSILNNLEKNENIDDSLFEKVYYEKATTAIDKIIKDIKEVIYNPFVEFFEIIREDIEKYKEFSVNENVISKFDCPKIKINEVFEELKKEIKEDNKECLELLGVFVRGEIANILINEKRIKETAQKHNLSFEVLKDFVRIHEYAHLFMNNNQKLDSNQIIFEEAFATAIALKMFEKTEYFEKLKKFVENLSFCYRYGLKFIHLSIENLIEVMEIWKKTGKKAHNFYNTQKYISDKNIEKFKKALSIFFT